MIVISDTSPLCYLLLINQIDILSALYGVVIIPQTVADELGAPASPPIVQTRMLPEVTSWIWQQRFSSYDRLVFGSAPVC